MLLRKHRSYAEVYNDLDCEIVNMFRVLRDKKKSKDLVEALRLTPFSRDEHIGSYIPSDCPIEQARRTVVRSLMGFGSNGLNQPTGFRNNANRSGTTPAHDWMHYPDCLPAIIERMQGVVIENHPAVSLIMSKGFNRRDVLVYADPPYTHSTRNTSGSGYAHEMSDDDHREMANALHECHSMVVVSGYACELYDKELFPDWHRVQRATNADGASKRTEVLWIKPNSLISPTLFDRNTEEIGNA